MLEHVGDAELPAHAKPGGGFDHAAVHAGRAHVYVAHTANDALDVIDGRTRTYRRSIAGLTGVAGVLVTGAMRHSSLPSADGPGNLSASVLTAASEKASGQGVLVCLNDEVHAARSVTKAHPTNVHAFRSLDFGPLAAIYAGAVHWHRAVTRCGALPLRTVSARVGLIKAAIEVDSLFFRACVDAGFDGLVLEATGGGHVPEAMLPGIELAVGRGLPVVMVSRCPIGGGLLRSTYGTVGSETHLRQMGVIWGDPLNAC